MPGSWHTRTVHNSGRENLLGPDRPRTPIGLAPPLGLDPVPGQTRDPDLHETQVYADALDISGATGLHAKLQTMTYDRCIRAAHASSISLSIKIHYKMLQANKKSSCTMRMSSTNHMGRREQCYVAHCFPFLRHRHVNLLEIMFVERLRACAGRLGLACFALVVGLSPLTDNI